MRKSTHHPRSLFPALVATILSSRFPASTPRTRWRTWTAAVLTMVLVPYLSRAEARLRARRINMETPELPLPLGKALQDFVEDPTTAPMDLASLSKFLDARPVRDAGQCLFDNITHRMEVARSFQQWVLETRPWGQSQLSPTAWSILMVSDLGVSELKGLALHLSLAGALGDTRNVLVVLKSCKLIPSIHSNENEIETKPNQSSRRSPG